MATIEKNIMPPAEATEIVRSSFDDMNKQLPFSSVFPMQSTGGEMLVTWTPELPKRQVDSVLFRAPDAEAGYDKDVEYEASAVTKLMLISKKSHVTEREITDHPNDDTYLHGSFDKKITKIGREVALRMEGLRITALLDGKYPVAENGLNMTWDFHRPSSLQDVTPTKKWTTADATPIEDIKKWRKLIDAAQGRVPTAVLTTEAVMEALSKNKEIIMAATNRPAADIPPSVDYSDVKRVLASRCGLLDIRVVDTMYTEIERANGIILPFAVETLIPDKTFIMFSSFNDINLGFTASGPTAEAQNAEYEINLPENEGLIAFVMSDNAPARYDMWVNGAMLPILKQAVSTLKADVL